MEYNKIFSSLFVFFLLASAAGTAAAATKVLFYETGKIEAKYKIGSGYSSFEEALVKKGYSVSRYEDILSREVLNNYDPDVLVIANLKTPLDASELAAIFEFVMQDGKGLFICGGTPAANQITIPFGMTIDEKGMLEDETSPVMDSSTSVPVSDKTNFVARKLETQDPTIRLAVQGVNELAFFGANGISIPPESDVKVIVRGDWDTYSPKSPTFPKGSEPPLASAALVGKGQVFLLTDADVLINDKLETSRYKYDNLRFGTNIIDWLKTSTIKPDEGVEIESLRVIIGQIMVDIETLNNTVIDLEEKNRGLQAIIQEKEASITALSDENANLKSQSILGISYTVWAIVFLAVAFLLCAMVMAKKKRKGKDKEEDLVGGLGYEFEEAEAGNDFGENAENFTGLLDMDNPDKSEPI